MQIKGKQHQIIGFCAGGSQGNSPLARARMLKRSELLNPRASVPKTNCPVIHSPARSPHPLGRPTARRSLLSSIVHEHDASSSTCSRLRLAAVSTRRRAAPYIYAAKSNWPRELKRIRGGICSGTKTIPGELPCLMAIWRSHAGFSPAEARMCCRNGPVPGRAA